MAERYNLDEFVRNSEQKDLNEGVFELESDRMLEVNLANGMVWTKLGAMVAYRGDLKFTREGIFEQGIANLFKKMISSEGARLTKVEGTGKLYAADNGKKITIFKLINQSVCVNANDVLAFEPTLKNEIKLTRKVVGMLAGGLFNVVLSGTGLVAITTHYDPLTLIVKPGNPVFSDPNATVAWSGHLQPQFKTDIQLKTFFGRGSGESIQMKFEGDGFVVIQPYEECVWAAK
ncbi:MAG: AIM24 family protein [Planctomycetaceae bacterium]|jgi:uncharacterized protein (AIM24 family)|nr:AIM24 family protein [Planctomycetaceae bacterium]